MPESHSTPETVRRVLRLFWAHLPGDVFVTCDPIFTGDALTGVYVTATRRDYTADKTYGIKLMGDGEPEQDLSEDVAAWAAECLASLDKAERADKGD